MFTFNPNLKEYKSLRGAIDVTQKLNIFVRTDSDWCKMLIKKDGTDYVSYSMSKDEAQGGFFVHLSGFTYGLYFYHFETENGLYGAGFDYFAKKQKVECLCDYQLTVTKNNYQLPDFLKGGIMYQIFPDRFCSVGQQKIDKGKILRKDWGGVPTYRNDQGLVLNNEFFGGNFKGIASKLDYLSQIGVTAIYLNPIVKAYSSHRYDTGDYLNVDELLGTIDDLKDLIIKADNFGISLIFDGVYNHTGADSLYFNKYGNYGKKGAYKSVKSPFYSWYSFTKYPDSYNSWWGFDNLPSINKNCKEFQKFICDKVLPFYFDLGFKGVRLDVVDELSDEFIDSIKKVAQKYNAIVIGEVWEDATNKIAYGKRRKYFLGDQLDSVMNYRLKDGICDYLLTGNTNFFVHVLMEQLNNYPKASLDSLMNILSTHDTVRIINNLGRSFVIENKDCLKNYRLPEAEVKKGKILAKIAYTLLFTVYGLPSIYYGDEVGMTGDLDPYNRCCYPWGDEDNDFLDYIKKLSKIRRLNSVFYNGELNLLYYDKDVLVYERSNLNQRIVVACSLSRFPVKLKFSAPMIDILFEGDTCGYTKTLDSQSIKIFKQLAN